MFLNTLYSVQCTLCYCRIYYTAYIIITGVTGRNDSLALFHDSRGSHFGLDFRLKCVTGRNDSPFMNPEGDISA